MSRFRLYHTPAQEAATLAHCGHARFVWNLAVEQQAWWRPGRGAPPGHAERNRQLTEARQTFDWLAAGSATVQQQALRDFAQAMANFFAGTHARPTWRKAGRHEGFRIVGTQARRIEKLSRTWSRVLIPKVRWGRLVARLEHKVPGRVIRVNPAYTSQRCSVCGHVAAENRKNQAVFRCVACRIELHADVNAARNIRNAAGRAVPARGALQTPVGAKNREPHSRSA